MRSFLFSIFTLSLIFTFTACEQDNQADEIIPITEANVVGTWRIDVFQDDDDDNDDEKKINAANRATLFANVTIEIKTNKTFIIRKNGAQTYTGVWSIDRDDTDGVDELEFDINENTDNPYSELEDDDWEIVNFNATNLWFSEDDDNNTDDEFRLVKN
jgi:hypothetical protein